MFEYKTTSKHDRKWFHSKNDTIYDLNIFKSFGYKLFKNNNKESFYVHGTNAEEVDFYMGKLDTEQDAKDYIKEIYNFLVAD